MSSSIKIIKEAVTDPVVDPIDKEIEIVENKKIEEVEEGEEGGEEVNTVEIKPATDVSLVTTVVTEKVVTESVGVETIKVVAEIIGLKMISESSLTDEQKKLATTIYDSVKLALQDFISDPNVNNTVKITKTIGQVIKHLENSNIDGKIPSGADKKAVAIQLGRILIKEVTPDDKGEAEILVVYDLIAEPTLEAMIEVSKVVNVAVHEIATKCCPGLLEIFKRVKATN